ncbi:hypothetical protein PR048_000311, partial [Dryococelus australis]
MAARKRSDIFVCGKDIEAMMRYFEMLTSESSSSEDEMDCDNIRLVAANQSYAVDNDTYNSSSDYWSKEVTVDTPYFRSVLQWRSFVALNKYLDLVYNETLYRADPLRKIHSIITMASNSFRAVYTPSGSMCIDESLMKCSRRLYFIQYNKSKHARFGIKFYKLCDSANSYIGDFKFYMEKDKTDGTLTSIAIVMYSSPDLFHRLFSAGTNYCGTVRTNRKHMPKELTREILKVGEAVAYSNTNITAMKWKDKREGSMLSTKHTLDFAETGKELRKMQTKIMKPTAVIDYDMKMRGID